MVFFKKWVFKRSNHYAYLGGRDFWWSLFYPLPVLLIRRQCHAGLEFGLRLPSLFRKKKKSEVGPNLEEEAWALDEVFSVVWRRRRQDGTTVPQASMQCSSADLMKEPSVTTTLREDFRRWGAPKNEKEFYLFKPKINWADLYVMFQDRRSRRWTNHSPRPHPCGCQVLFSEEMEIDLEDKWWLQLEEEGPLTQSFWKRRRSQFTSREELHEEGSPSAIKEGEIEEMISSIQ